MLGLMPPPRKKSTPAAGPVPEPEKKKPNRAGKPVNVWLPLEMHDAIEAFRNDQRVKPKLTDVVELAIQEFLQREGFWPAADADSA